LVFKPLVLLLVLLLMLAELVMVLWFFMVHFELVVVMSQQAWQPMYLHQTMVFRH
jgi:hypothetical protein